MKSIFAWALMSAASAVIVKPGSLTDSFLLEELESEGKTVPLDLTGTIPPMEVNLTGNIGGATFDLDGEMPELAATEETGPNKLLVDSKVRPTQEGMASFATLFDGVRDGKTPTFNNYKEFNKFYQATHDGFTSSPFYHKVYGNGEAGIILIKTTEGGSFGYYFDFAIQFYPQEKQPKDWKSFMFYFDQAGAHKIELDSRHNPSQLLFDNHKQFIGSGRGWVLGNHCDQPPWDDAMRPSHTEGQISGFHINLPAKHNIWNFGYNFKRPDGFHHDQTLTTKMIGGDKWVFSGERNWSGKPTYGHFYQCTEIEYFFINWE